LGSYFEGKHKLQVSEEKVLRAKSDEVNGDWRTSHYESHHDL